MTSFRRCGCGVRPACEVAGLIDSGPVIYGFLYRASGCVVGCVSGWFCLGVQGKKKAKRKAIWRSQKKKKKGGWKKKKKKRKKKWRQIYVPLLEKGSALWEHSINPPTVLWHRMPHRSGPALQQPGEAGLSHMEEHRYVFISLFYLFFIFYTTLCPPFSKLHWSLHNPTSFEYQEGLVVVAMEGGGRRGGRQLIPAQSCSHQRQKDRVGVDKIKLPSSKKVEKQGSCDPVINDTRLVTGVSRGSFQRREL